MRATAGTPPKHSKARTRPSKVWLWSSEVVNHHIRLRDQHKIAPKQRSGRSHPHAEATASRLQKSNCSSSPGPVKIGTDAAAAALKRGPRMSLTARTTVG